MKKYIDSVLKGILIGSAAVFVASTAKAETRYANITNVQPNYQTVYMNVPRQQCQDVEVPVYGNTGGGASGGDVLGGMIIGGLLGKGATGKDDGAAIGAIIGGMVAAENNNGRRVVTGYRIERQCSEVMTREQQREIKNYTITYRWNGITAQSYTYNRYNVGDRISVNVSINAN